jgi:hypothetical protein
VRSLPGIYPADILLSVERLAKNKKISQNTFNIISRDSKKPSSIKLLSIPILQQPPHPLDFEWRFTDKTVINLAKYCLSISDPGDSIGLLGVPSLFRLVQYNNLNRKFFLFDKNPVEQEVRVEFSRCIPCDLGDYKINCCSIAKIVLMDSPWYPEYNRAFLWNATKICKEYGLILMVTPKEGTRPNIKEEWREILNFSKQIGLGYLGESPENIVYDAPYFERNALKAAGILNFPRDWRQANLSVFEKREERSTQQPTITETVWHNDSNSGIRVRKSQDNNDFHDPRLIPIVPNDILPTVSRRDPRRKQAQVWTHGNRIFDCKGTNVLHKILHARNFNESPEFHVELLIERKINKKEKILISQAKTQIDDLIKLERVEQCIL